MKTRTVLALGLAVACISTGAPFAQLAAPAPPIAIAALRVGIAALLLLAAGWREVSGLRQIARRDWGFVVLSGLLLALHFGSWIASLSFTSTAASVALVCTNPIFAALFGRMFLGDRVAPREVMGIGIAAAGCAVLAGGDWQAGGDALVGDGLALVGAASAAGYLVVGRRLRTAVPLLPYLGTVNAIAAIALVIAATVTGANLAALDGRAYLACAGAALVASFVGHSLLNAAVRTTPTHLVALAILGEPVGSSLITWIAFGEEPPVYAAIGGAIVLVGIAAGFVRRAQA
ncbi:MAG TPA: DMT family transporter [Kofleriaceae bacterium]|nr:DMT family transporter [Kofleriaceae bacterium]